MKILISGVGIAGPCLAYWLLQHGFEPVLVERAPELRREGYVVDFWGAGFEIARRMGILPRIEERGYHVREVRIVNAAGESAGGFSVKVFDRLTHGNYTSVPRGELATALYAALDGRVETLLGDSITELTDTGDGVRVQFQRAEARTFDVVVGADGLHSQVRRLAFGEQAKFEKYLGYKVAAFECTGYRPRDELTYVLFQKVGQQLGRFALRDDRTMFLFVFLDEEQGHLGEDVDHRAELHRRFSGAGWESDQILAAMAASESLYFDRVSQIRMARWSQGRVALVGDAAYCVSLLAGQGSALAMVGAYVLAGELKLAAGDHTRAFSRYHERLAPLLAQKQRSAEKFANSFAPRTKVGLFLRNQVTRLLSIPLVADLTLGRDLKDDIELPDY